MKGYFEGNRMDIPWTQDEDKQLLPGELRIGP
jgi:hypothetical protein